MKVTISQPNAPVINNEIQTNLPEWFSHAYVNVVAKLIKYDHVTFIGNRTNREHNETQTAK